MTDKVNVALVGVGNNASALVQGCVRYRTGATATAGVMAPVVGGYALGDIRFVCAFDVSRRKVGRDLSEAIHAEPNNFPAVEPVSDLGAPVFAGPLLDSLHESLRDAVPVDEPRTATADPAGTAQLLRAHRAHVLVNFLPAGSPAATRFYADVALAAGCAYINATPEPVARDSHYRAAFADARLPLLGDDLESQMGATVLHRAVLHTLASKGIHITGSYQINVGGNMDFRNLNLRGGSKRESKRRALLLPPGTDGHVNVVPAAAHFEFLGDRKIAHITVEAEGWLGFRNTVELRLEIQDSASAASVVADLVRIARYELNGGPGGVVDDAGFYFKSPRVKVEPGQAVGLVGRYTDDVVADAEG